MVLFVGQRRPTKRYELLLAAAPLVWRRHPDALFAFVGPGAPLPTGDPRILDVGRVSDAERGAWLGRATMLCLPSVSESFGMVVAEAWSQGLPVVVSDIPVLRELVTASGGGIVARPDPDAMADAIGALLADPAGRPLRRGGGPRVLARAADSGRRRRAPPRGLRAADLGAAGAHASRVQPHAAAT